MTVEPISSMMTIQAQPAQKVVVQSSESANTQAKPANEYVSGGQDVPQVDTTTAVVGNVSESSGDGAADANTSNAQAQNEEMVERNNEKVKKAMEELNKNMSNSVAQFGIHEGTNRITIKIVDKETKEVIKELPPEKTLDMIAKAWEMAGLMVDERR